MRLTPRATALAAASLALGSVSHAGGMPEGFVYLADIAPTVRQDLRYAGERNFTGSRVPGYGAAECILAEPAAQALSHAGDALSARGLGLLALDCYRPAKAVRRFVAWAEGGKGLDPAYHPRVDRGALFAEGYIARRSGHSAGYTVDVTLTDADGAELDMGTPFDFFDPRAQTTSKDIPAKARERRRILVDAMRAAGFVNYSREWWHFTLKKRPAKAPALDFDILPRGG
jgi:D-alanyl-D-alanine dipeptidase